MRPPSAYTPAVDLSLEREVPLAVLVEDIAARLGSVCVGMPPAAFDALVRDIACRKQRWAQADRPPR